MLLCHSAPFEKAEFLAKIGYEAIDLSLCETVEQGDRHDPLLDSEDWSQRVAELARHLQKLNLTVSSTHLPFRFDYIHTDKPEFPALHKIACRSLKASEQLGAKWAVMHIDKIDTNFDTVVAETAKYARRLLKDSGVKEVGLAIENTSKRPVEAVIAIHDLLKEEGYHVGICLDVGHCHINKFHGITYDVPTVVRQLGDRLKMLHLHDNCRNADMHTMPFSGTLPWEETMKALKEIGYRGDFNLEVSLDHIPAPLQEAHGRYCVETARYLMEFLK